MLRAMVKKIGTHNGVFHCDEALACYLLKVLPEFKDAEIIRTRDEKVLESCDVVVDVGGIFDPEKFRFDHHQREFNESMKSLSGGKYPWTTKLSSAGLVYYHFGERIIAELLKRKADDKLVGTIFMKTYEHLIEEIDAIDNGISICPDDMKKYHITTHLSARLGRLNPTWLNPEQDTDQIFPQAVALAGSEFFDRVNFYGNVWWPAKAIVVEAFEKRFQIHESGEILELPKSGCPWKEHLYDVEREQGIEGVAKFVIYTDTNGKWRVQGIPIAQGSFANRVPLLEAWRGLRDEELSKRSGIPGCVFVHTSGFIGGNTTREGALEMAAVTLEHAHAKNDLMEKKT
ncbi:unnamed protein product [Cyprideis torosa]|uniref:Uncharacterized protein n=1 Tax=Cyprideis torosa TaxID=163714 RepID=A0A7R8ZNA6_9CRUS|nr:unnamed protein product [Cyprideis torosa]CAG0891137.1 unnamed protein product [Cyprideis torosa]